MNVKFKLVDYSKQKKRRKPIHKLKYEISDVEDYNTMQMTYAEALTKFAALSELEKGRTADAPYDLPWQAWILITTMMNALNPYIEGYQKGRAARFKRIGKGHIKSDQFGQPSISDPILEMKFRLGEEKVLNADVNILMPVSKLELDFEKNKYPPTLLLRLSGLYNQPADKTAQFKMEEGEATPIPTWDEEEDDMSGNVIKMDKNA